MDLEQHFRKLECEADHLYFTRYFFKQRQNIKFRLNFHHHIFADAIQDVIAGRCKRLLINVAPGSSKTEEVVINFMARGLALNPWSRFLHLSYSDDLALLNSQTTRDLVSSDEYQAFWPFKIADDQKAKKRWNVIVDGKIAGGVYAAALGGQITGFRAGHMVEGFSGALVIDDPLKPEDAFSEPKLKQANRRLLTTVKSRLAHPDIPIVVIMQRISERDPAGFILSGSLGEGWRHIVVPALIDEEYVKKLEPKYQPMIERDAPERFSYWPYKEPVAQLLAMERGEGTDSEGQRISRHVFTSQYQQAPRAVGGNIIHGNWFKYYKLSATPKMKYRKVYVDTAQKTAERNDRSVFECWGHGEDGKIYLLDLLKGKWEAPELKKRAITFWEKQKGLNSEGELNPFLKKMAQEKHGQLRQMIVEDKSSGTGLIQEIRLLNHIPIKGVERVKDKLTRVMDVVSYIESGMVMVPEDADFTADFVAENEAFTADDTHSYDDQIDPMVDAINDMLSSNNKLETWRKLI